MDTTILTNYRRQNDGSRLPGGEVENRESKIPREGWAFFYRYHGGGYWLLVGACPQGSPRSL